ncbi:MAG: RusA family crossover junction endodeoxyribonuclease [Thermoanaerobacter sp.]|nr:RusA family crossover junction endodeoxyribonuclease [Thermoanaerobacter sp.]
MIHFTVYGHPVPKARARVVRTKNGKTVSYTPGRTADWENSIRAQALACRQEKLLNGPLDGPLVVAMTFYLLRPKSRPKREKWPDRRPDLDNLVKSVKDALNGIIWTDDARIVDMRARKRYDSQPRVEIVVRKVVE